MQRRTRWGSLFVGVVLVLTALATHATNGRNAQLIPAAVEQFTERFNADADARLAKVSLGPWTCDDPASKEPTCAAIVMENGRITPIHIAVATALQDGKHLRTEMRLPSPFLVQSGEQFVRVGEFMVTMLVIIHTHNPQLERGPANALMTRLQKATLEPGKFNTARAGDWAYTSEVGRYITVTVHHVLEFSAGRR